MMRIKRENQRKKESKDVHKKRWTRRTKKFEGVKLQEKKRQKRHGYLFAKKLPHLNCIIYFVVHVFWFHYIWQFKPVTLHSLFFVLFLMASEGHGRFSSSVTKKSSVTWISLREHESSEKEKENVVLLTRHMRQDSVTKKEEMMNLSKEKHLEPGNNNNDNDSMMLTSLRERTSSSSSGATTTGSSNEVSLPLPLASFSRFLSPAPHH